MDDDKEDKSIFQKVIETVKDLSSSVTDAATHAMEPEPTKPGEEVVMLPMEGSGMLGQPAMPPFVVIPRKRTKKAPKKTARKTAKKETKKTAKRTPRKTKPAVKKKKAKAPVKKKKKAKRASN